MKNAITWFEIPVSDIQRAVAFYNTIFGYQMETMETMMGSVSAFFPMDDPMSESVGGSLTQAEWHKPSQEGALVYLNGGDDLDTVLSRVADAGGQVLWPKTSIGENGFIAVFVDTEGNRVGLHSPH